MADLLTTLFERLSGAKMPVAPEQVSPEEAQLRDELVRREQAKLSGLKQRLIGGVEGAGDFISGLFSDPTSPDFQQFSGAKKLGVLGAAAPLFPPKAIKGLFSRVEKIAESLPENTHPSKLASILKNRASQDEIQWRGLDKLIQRAGGDQLKKADVVQQLQEYPMDVKVVELGSPSPTRKGVRDNYGQLHIIPRGEEGTYPRTEPWIRPTQFDNYQMLPGASNYRETLLTLPVDENSATIAARRGYGATNSDLGIFQSHHWDIPNPLVHIRHNERNLPNPGSYEASMEALADTNKTGPLGRMLENVQSDWHQRGAHDGYIGGPRSPSTQANESLQQQLNVSTNLLQTKLQEASKLINDPAKQTYLDYPDDILSNDNIAYISSKLSQQANVNPELQAVVADLQQARVARDNALDAMRRNVGEPVPDAPFKDSWAELALKQQLLDVADRPDLQWIGIAPQSELAARGEGISPEFQDVQLPRTLEKLLRPFGGSVEKVDLGFKKEPSLVFSPRIGEYGGIGERALGSADVNPILSFMPPTEANPDPNFLLGRWAPSAEMVSSLSDQIQHSRPDVQAFIARLTPEMKERIKASGFPMLSIMLMMQQAQGDQSDARPERPTY